MYYVANYSTSHTPHTPIVKPLLKVKPNLYWFCKVNSTVQKGDFLVCFATCVLATTVLICRITTRTVHLIRLPRRIAQLAEWTVLAVANVAIFTAIQFQVPFFKILCFYIIFQVEEAIAVLQAHQAKEKSSVKITSSAITVQD